MLTNLRRFRFLICAAILAVAVISRIAAFSPGLEYDEIWTIRNYSARSIFVILNDLATPNNHPLNSLAVRGMLFFSYAAEAIRLPAFLCGIASVFLAGWLAWLLFRSRFIQFSTMFLIAVNPGLVFYSVIARGYSMQTALILLFAVLAALAYRTRKIYPLILLPVSALLAELTIPTSVLWLFPIALIHGTAELIRCRKNWKKIIPCAVSYCVTGILLLSWILLHYHDFKAGQSFGRSVLVFPLFAGFMRETLNGLLCMGTAVSVISCLLLLIFAVCDRCGRKTFCALLFLLFFPFGMALFTLAGPARVYLPSVPFLALAFGFLLYRIIHLIWKYIERKPLRLILYLLIIALPVFAAFSQKDEGGKQWNRTDWIEKFQQYRKVSPEYFFCFQPVDSYPALYNNGKAILEDYLIRLNSMKDGSFFVMPDSSGSIGGMLLNGNTDSLKISGRDKIVRFSGEELRLRILKSYSGKISSRIAVLRVNGIPPKFYQEAVSYLEKSPHIRKIMLLNCFFTSGIQNLIPGNRLFGVLLAEISGTVESQDFFLNFQRGYMGNFDFFELSK